MIQIDVDKVLRTRLPRYYRFIPSRFVRWLEQLVCQDEMNEMLRVNRGLRGADFSRGVLDHLAITYDIHGSDNLRPRIDPRPVIVCNHPLGGLDGMVLIDIVSRIYGRPVKFLVNDLLMAIEPLSDIFLPVNKHGQQSRQAIAQVDEAFAADSPIIIFPAGLVSRRHADGTVSDLEWQKSFVTKSRKYGRNVIPAIFSGKNSEFFYKFARLRTRLGLRLNIEMVRLPKEVFLCRGRHFDVTFGNPIAPDDLKGNPQAVADRIRGIAYSLADTVNN